MMLSTMLNDFIMPNPLDVMMSDVLRSSPCRRTSNAHFNSRAPVVEDKDDHFAVVMPAPGVKAEDLKVSFKDDALTIVGETTTATGSHTHFINWTMRFPATVDSEAIKASHVDGLLQVKLPKIEKNEAVETKQIIAADSEATPTDDAPRYNVTIPAAGVAKSDLSITVEAGVLKVSGETKRTGVRLVSRTFRLPRDADMDDVRASHVDGLLTVSVKKRAPPEAKQIEIRNEADDEAAVADEPNEADDAVMV